MAKAKDLKFGVTLMTGTFQQNLKRCLTVAQKAWVDFGENMKKSNSILDATNAMYMLGKQGYEAALSLFHPYEQLAQKIIGVGIAVKAVCSDFEKFEKASLKASKAFQTGGITRDFNKFKGQLEEATAGGMGNMTDSMDALETVRRGNPSLNSKELSEIIELAKDGTVVYGSFADAVENLGNMFGAATIREDQLTKAGINFTWQEMQAFKASNNRWNMHRRNAMIIAKFKELYSGAAAEEATTLSGMYRRIGNMLENLKVKFGEMIAPLAKPFFQLAVLIMNIAEGFIKPFAVVAKIIGAVFSPLTNLLTKCAGLCKFIGSLLGIIVTVWLAKWIKSQLTILALNGKFDMIFQMMAVGWHRANQQVLLHIGLLKTATLQKMKLGATNAWGGIKSFFGFGGAKAGAKGASSAVSKVAKIGGKGALQGFAAPVTLASIVGSGGGFTKVLGALARAVGTLSKFAGPVALVVVALMGLYKFFSGYIKGFTEGFNKAGKQSKSFVEILGQVWSIIGRILKIIWDTSPLKLLLWLLEKVGYYIGKLAGGIASVLLPVLDSAVSFIEDALTSVNDFFKEAYFRFWEMWGVNMDDERAEYEREKADAKKKHEPYQSPDFDFSSSFESAASMNQRIQSSVLSKSSPAVRMCDYLASINEVVKLIQNGTGQIVKETFVNGQKQEETNKHIKNMNVGLL